MLEALDAEMRGERHGRVAGSASPQLGMLAIGMFLSALQVSYAEIGPPGADAQQQSGGWSIGRKAAQPGNA